VGAYIARRLLSGLLLLLALTLVTYVVFYTIPVHPGCLVVQCGGQGTATPEQLAAADHAIGADRPVIVQYGHFVWGIVRHASLGHTFRGDVPVTTLLKGSLPATISLVVGGAALLLLVSIPLAVAGALRPRSWLDRGILFVTLFGIAFHPFVIGLILRNRGYCPLRGGGDCHGPGVWATHLMLPWITFAAFFLPFYVRMLRGRVIEALGEPHVIVARAKGASELRIVRSHLLRGALPPVIAMLAMDVGAALTAAIYVETVFGMNGLGALALHTLSGDFGAYDLPTIVGIVVVIAIVVVVLNIVADIVSAALDPRIRLQASTGVVRMPRLLERAGGLFPTPVRVAIAVAAAAGVVVLYHETGGHPAQASTPVPGEPRHEVRLGWNEQAGHLRVQVGSVAVGRRTWVVRAAVENRSPQALNVDRGRNTSSFDAGPSLLVSYRPPGALFAELRVVPATDVEPALPSSLAPGERWSGTFSGLGKIPHGTLVHVGIGAFAMPDRGHFTWVSQNSFELG
jgi:peptide/nickel transport system permease protein